MRALAALVAVLLSISHALAGPSPGKEGATTILCTKASIDRVVAGALVSMDAANKAYAVATRERTCIYYAGGIPVTAVRPVLSYTDFAGHYYDVWELSITNDTREKLLAMTLVDVTWTPYVWVRKEGI